MPSTMNVMMMKDPVKPSSDETAKMGSKDNKQEHNSDEVVRKFVIPRTRSLPGCPLCDASVYSYCDEKVYHDACCCGSINGAAPFGGAGGGFGGAGGGFGGFGGFGRQGFGGQGGFGGPGGGGCGYKGCGFLYANSCYEHQLIVNCCCNSPY
uniref:CCC domain-containing protein n=1 Tax=Anopheles christyi TaxID=43041 RepID=A0A182K4W5_9DIPT